MLPPHHAWKYRTVSVSADSPAPPIAGWPSAPVHINTAPWLHPFIGDFCALRAVPPLRTAFLLWLSQGLCLNLSVTIGAEGSHVPHYRRATESCHLHAGGRMARNRSRPCLSRDNHALPVSTSSGIRFDTSSMVHFRSSL